ncbi:MAG: LacI family DNA-binding transcriptional regulator [Lachnospiraceae bacterium]
MAATIKDIARETGLGLATISSYLNGGNVREKNREKIEKAIKELDFEINEMARGLKTNRTKTIGVIIPELNSVFCAEVLTEVEDILRTHGYAMMICDCRSDAALEKEAFLFLAHRRVDGLIIMPAGTSGRYLKPFLKANKPIVLIDRKIEGIDCDSVLVDNHLAVEEATSKLIRAGHTKIGLIAGPEGIYTADERTRGYELALRKAGLPVEQKLIVHGNYEIQGGVAAIQKLVKLNPAMTAVFVSNYEMTMGAVIGINELGLRMPEQISFIGFDNTEFARATIPKLCIVEQPTKQIAGEVARIMLERVNQTEAFEPETVRLQTNYIEGNSIRVLTQGES